MKNLSMKNFSLWEIYNNNKTKSENIDFARVINCTCKLTCVCLHVYVRSHVCQGTVCLWQWPYPEIKLNTLLLANHTTKELI